MSDSLLRKYTGVEGRSPLTERERSLILDDAESVDDLGVFGWLRGVRERAMMLELRRKDGNIRAIAYAWLESVEFDPSSGLTLHAAGKSIYIRGRHFNTEVRPAVRLFDGLIRHRVPWVREASEKELIESPEHATIVERIEW